MQLERLVAAFLARLGEIGIRLRSVKSAFDLIATHGAGISGDLVPIAAQQLVHGLIQVTSRQVP